jgi:hypothetical protein
MVNINKNQHIVLVISSRPKKNNEMWRVNNFTFICLDKFIWLYRLTDKKRQETKKDLLR